MPKTATATRAEELLPLLQELVYLNVRRWDIERQIETGIFDGVELEFMGDTYEEHVAGLSFNCDEPGDAYRKVTLEDASAFAECLEDQSDKDGEDA